MAAPLTRLNAYRFLIKKVGLKGLVKEAEVSPTPAAGVFWAFRLAHRTTLLGRWLLKPQVLREQVARGGRYDGSHQYQPHVTSK
jgi:hypothetical protein